VRIRLIRAGAASLVVGLAVWAPGCSATNGDVPAIEASGPTVETEHGVATPYGEDAEKVWVLQPKEMEPSSIVVFVHGWTATVPFDWQQVWLDHLLADGNIVVFPVYQGLESSDWGVVTTLDMRDGLVAGFAALADTDLPVVAAGFSVGGALAFFYAANAEQWDLPVPKGVYGIFPVDPITFDPSFDARPLPPIEVVLFTGEDDYVVGRGGADAIWAWVEDAPSIPPSSKTYRMIPTTDRVFTLHDVPTEVGNAAVRRVFWKPLDRMIENARSAASGDR
jgi:pimeloyl-ACP methyl ester carboxylesterase